MGRAELLANIVRKLSIFQHTSLVVDVFDVLV
jgi:hypothetical protein